MQRISTKAYAAFGGTISSDGFPRSSFLLLSFLFSCDGFSSVQFLEWSSRYRQFAREARMKRHQDQVFLIPLWVKYRKSRPVYAKRVMPRAKRLECGLKRSIRRGLRSGS